MSDLATRLGDPAFQAAYREAVEAHVADRAVEAHRWRDACADGDCAYARRSCEPPDLLRPRACLSQHAHGCPGYVGVQCLEHGKPLMRYRLCARREVWHRAAVSRLQAQRDRAASGGKRPPKSTP
jgi:hypothetical protein